MIGRRAPWLIWALAACAGERPDRKGFAEATVMAGEVEAENLMPVVRALTDGHAADVKVSCDGYPPIEGLPTCELSRDAAFSLVHDAFVGLGFSTSHHISGEGAALAKNLIADWPGGEKASEVVLVGAHFDAHYSGADDNSSGVAAMLEVARVAAQHRFARSVRFVGFDLEERGSIGSTRFVEAGMADDVVAALILECVGYASTKKGSQQSPIGMPLGDRGDFLAVVANGDSVDLAQRLLALNHGSNFVKVTGLAAGGRGLYFLTSPLTRSDNGPLWLREVPTLLFSDTANLRNPNYHEAGDLPETLDPGFLAGSTRLIAAAVALFAEVQP